MLLGAKVTELVGRGAEVVKEAGNIKTKAAATAVMLGATVPLTVAAIKHDSFSSEKTKKAAKTIGTLATIAGIGVAAASLLLGKQAGFQGKEMLTKGFGIFKGIAKDLAGKGMEKLSPLKDKAQKVWQNVSEGAKNIFNDVKSKFSKSEVVTKALEIVE